MLILFAPSFAGILIGLGLHILNNNPFAASHPDTLDTLNNR